MFGLALDEQKENDEINSDNKVTFVVESDVVKQFGGFTVESMGNGFKVIPNIQPVSGCSSCGGSCG